MSIYVNDNSKRSRQTTHFTSRVFLIMAFLIDFVCERYNCLGQTTITALPHHEIITFILYFALRQSPVKFLSNLIHSKINSFVPVNKEFLSSRRGKFARDLLSFLRCSIIFDRKLKELTISLTGTLAKLQRLKSSSSPSNLSFISSLESFLVMLYGYLCCNS